jgi:hypothetical protein
VDLTVMPDLRCLSLATMHDLTNKEGNFSL